MFSSNGLRVVIPVKSFAAAKVRLSPVLSPTQRARLAESLATHVLQISTAFDVAIACDDDRTDKWARDHGADVIRTDGQDLNGAARTALEVSAEGGWPRIAVVHSDLPLARPLEQVILGGSESVLIVPDRHRDGTNVLVVPTDADFRFCYGPGSFDSHSLAAQQIGHRVEIIDDQDLAWDIDEPEDLILPVPIGRVPPHLRSLVQDGVLQTQDSRKETQYSRLQTQDSRKV